MSELNRPQWEIICKNHGSLGIVAQAYLGLTRTHEVNLKWDVHRLKVDGPHDLEIRPYKPEKWQKRN